MKRDPYKPFPDVGSERRKPRALRRMRFAAAAGLYLALVACRHSEQNAMDSDLGQKWSDPPIALYVQRKGGAGGAAILRLQADADHAIQISEFNSLKAVVDGKSTPLLLAGKPRTDKPDYYAEIDAVTLPGVGAKTFHVGGRVLFCNLKANYCLRKDLKLDIDK